MTKCIVNNCESEYYIRKGMCNKHYKHNHRYGDPLIAKHNTDNISYSGMHFRVRHHRGKASLFDCCNDQCIKQARQWAMKQEAKRKIKTTLFDGRNNKAREVEYALDIEDYIPLCITCHNLYDKKILILEQKWHT